MFPKDTPKSEEGQEVAHRTMWHKKQYSRATFVLVTALALLMTTGHSVSAGPVNISGELIDGEGCAAMGGSFASQSILSDTGWFLSESPLGVVEATREILVSFASHTLTEVTGDPSAGEPEIQLEECSGGLCSVIVHVYNDSVTSVRVHNGLYGFLPFGYQAGLGIGTTTMTTSESEIACTGTLLAGLTASGGVGPRAFSSAIWKDQGTQQVETCTYTNIPDIDDSCTHVYSKDFEIEARTPGVYTSFDVINGGRISNRPAQEVHLATVGVLEGAPVFVDDVQIGPLLGSSSGEWLVSYTGIEIAADTGQALALLDEAL